MAHAYGSYMFSHPSNDNNSNNDDDVHGAVRNLRKVEGSLS